MKKIYVIPCLCVADIGVEGMIALSKVENDYAENGDNHGYGNEEQDGDAAVKGNINLWDEEW